MKRRYFFGSLMLSWLFHVGAHAQAQYRTPYEQLAERFWNAPQRATLADFESNHWDRCVYYDVQTPMTAMPTHVRTLGFGYAGHFEQRVDVFNDPIVAAHAAEFFNASHLVLNASYFLQVLDGPGWLKTEIYGKRERGTLLFHVARSNYGGPSAPVEPKGYGACWNNSGHARPDVDSETAMDDASSTQDDVQIDAPQNRGANQGPYGAGEDADDGTIAPMPQTPPTPRASQASKPKAPKSRSPQPPPSAAPSPQPLTPPPSTAKPPLTAKPPDTAKSPLTAQPPVTTAAPASAASSAGPTDGDVVSAPSKRAPKVTSSVSATPPMPLPPPPGADGK
jgi:hypothetical protein